MVFSDFQVKEGRVSLSRTETLTVEMESKNSVIGRLRRGKSELCLSQAKVSEQRQCGQLSD